MATKKELLQTLTDAGIEGFSLSDDKADMEAAVAKIQPAVIRQKGV
jgi:hypothetical protein